MTIRKRTIRRMTPVARRLAKLANESQIMMRKLKWFIGDVQELERAVEATKLNKIKEDVFDVQPQDKGGSNPQGLPSGKKRKGRHDQVGQSGNRRSSAGRTGARPRNKRKKFAKGEKAI